MNQSPRTGVGNLRRGRLWLILAATATLFSIAAPSANATSVHLDSASASMARPAAHWGAFSHRICFQHAYRFAQSALRKYGFQEFGRGNNSIVGGNSSTVVQVSYAPGSNYRDGFSDVPFQVLAVSNSSIDAERARNNIRANIKSVRYFDTC
ncbi:hypothetical protein AB0M44_29920 [Streptosporangium subroseum]|uniref:hypothetical protein n=1 Tax=Streptosporangium subroseum TaxID=106412 RepID=UPI0034334152